MNQTLESSQRNFLKKIFEIAREALKSKSSTSSSSSKKKKPLKSYLKRNVVKKIRTGLLRKKQSEATALEIVEKLLDSEIEFLWFEEEALPSLNQMFYKDVIDERSLLKLCGYPLCTHSLPKIIPRQKYHIVSSQRKVYDLTERKKFCSNSCYNASSYILEQLDNEPLWMRDDKPGSERPMIKILGKRLWEISRNQTLISLPPKPKKTNSSPIELIKLRLKEWCTTDTLRYLKGDDFVCSWRKSEFIPGIATAFNEMITADIINNKVTESLKFSLDPMDNLKLMTFLKGRTDMWMDNEKEKEDNSELHLRMVPKVISRTQVVWNQLDSVLPEILTLFGIQMPDISDDVRILIKGFYLTSSNIVFSMHEWTLLALVILEMIRDKNVKLRTVLKSKDAKKYLNMLLLNFDLEEKAISSMIINSIADINLLMHKGAFKSNG
ncbi:RPAP2 [Lepeophtheirus salmonis]|uniref:RNA polymerase II subunit B1 CTD phosphatase RPAP2 homolog n=1 Tax=Lepeophtheirus salmonis TaxID=72036 RepID=A0A7R8CGS3_LEPSM|nr:RPAP2 [Lepeophtheirus salmonis]CAF2772872.1 RPAP2 [Lepeophtheirus salmonis]